MGEPTLILNTTGLTCDGCGAQPEKLLRREGDGAFWNYCPACASGRRSPPAWPLHVIAVPTALEMLADLALIKPQTAQKVGACVLTLSKHLDAAEASLAACRERLAALVAAREQHASLIGDFDVARDWLAAHPAEGGQDG